MTRVILHAPSRYGRSTRHYLIFFITGNPGLIAYYTSFLSTLSQLLSSESAGKSVSDATYHVFGQSLPGFEDNDVSDPASTRTAPFGLQEEIDMTFDTLKAQRISGGVRKGDNFDGVILVGHSVGSYILLELLGKARQDSSQSARIKAGILLFPTVTHIAQSPSGLKLTALLRIPDFPRMVKTFVKGLVWPLPRLVLKWLVALVTRMPPDATEATLGLLTSRRGVWQALHMAKDEMETITEDRWDTNIWGVEHSDPDIKESIPKLIFYFGRNDHWVADHTRDTLIASRGKVGGSSGTSKPRMLIDQDQIPHGFCINHSEIVAEKVKIWIDDIMDDV